MADATLSLDDTLSPAQVAAANPKGIPQAVDTPGGEPFDLTGSATSGRYQNAISDLRRVTTQHLGELSATERENDQRDARLRARQEQMLDQEGATVRDLKNQGVWNADQELAKHKTDLWSQFGSPGFVIAMVASAFTAMPMNSALNAGAAAMNAINQGDMEGYNKAFEAWKTNTDLTLKRLDEQHKEYADIDHLRSSNMADWRAKMATILAKYGDERKLALLNNGYDEELQHAVDAEAVSGKNLAQSRDFINETNMKTLWINSQPGVWKEGPDGKRTANPIAWNSAKQAWDSLGDPAKSAYHQFVTELWDKEKRLPTSEEILDFEKRQSEAKFPYRVGATTTGKEDAMEIDRRKQLYIKEGMSETAAFDRAKKEVKQAGATLLDDATIDTMARQYLAGDKSVFQNLGRGAQGAENVVRVREAVQRVAKEQGLKGEDVALRIAEFNALTAGERTLGTRTANAEMFVNEARNQMQVARRASMDVPRGEFVPVNQALLSWEENTGDPKVVAFGAAINTLVNTYAKAIAGGGQATVSDKDHARGMLKSAYTPEQFDAILEVLDKEMEAAREAPRQVKQQFRDLAHGGKLEGIPTPDKNVIKYDAQGNRIQ